MRAIKGNELEHVFDIGGGAENAHGSEMITDPHGASIGTFHSDGDGGITFTDDHGQAAGTMTNENGVTHVENTAGQQIASISHDTVYDASNLPVEHILQHGSITDISDLNGNQVGHIVRTANGTLFFDGAYPPHESGFSTDF